jgi:hypothetical protein
MRQWYSSMVYEASFRNPINTMDISQLQRSFTPKEGLAGIPRGHQSHVLAEQLRILQSAPNINAECTAVLDMACTEELSGWRLGRGIYRLGCFPWFHSDSLTDY